MRFHAAIALAACLAPAAAIFEDDAYHIDFHYALLGLPAPEATFFQKPYAGSKASLLYSISQNQTIGAINPKDGASRIAGMVAGAYRGRAGYRHQRCWKPRNGMECFGWPARVGD